MPLAWGSEKPSGFGVAVEVVVSQPEEAIAEVAFVAAAAAEAAAAAALPAELG